MIQLRNVSREFQILEKQPGLKGYIASLFSPKKSTFHALKNISFDLPKGSFVGLIGANGAGKTTLLKLLSGLVPPTSGSIEVMGEVPFSRSLSFRQNIALVMGQKAQLWWDLPAHDAFLLLKAIYQISDRDYNTRLHELTSLLDVKRHLHTQIRKLSLGERMKMELIGALIHWPSIIFLDEPTIGLDGIAAARLRSFLKSFHQDRQVTVILTSHNMDDIESLCSDIFILRSGELVFQGSPAGLINQNKTQLKVRLQTPMAPKDLQALLSLSFPVHIGTITEDEQSTGWVLFELQKGHIPALLQALIQHTSLTDISMGQESLETVIHRIYTASKTKEMSS